MDIKEKIVEILKKSLYDCLHAKCSECKYEKYKPKETFTLNFCICHRMADDIIGLLKKGENRYGKAKSNS